MKHLTRNKDEKGFALIEVMVAIFVITIGIIGAVNLVNYSISSVIIGKSQVIAANLAQEGVEIVRNIRDSNWVEDVDWDNGLINGPVDCSSGCLVQYDSTELISFVDEPLKFYNGFYQYAGLDEDKTRFYRKITIIDIGIDEIKVVSEVTWEERGRSYAVPAEDRLYDWR